MGKRDKLKMDAENVKEVEDQPLGEDTRSEKDIFLESLAYKLELAQGVMDAIGSSFNKVALAMRLYAEASTELEDKNVKEILEKMAPEVDTLVESLQALLPKQEVESADEVKN